MRNKIRIAALALASVSAVSLFQTAQAALPIIPQHKDVVGAYYYPWYFPGKWKDLQTQLTPTLGLYQSDSMPIVIKHIDTAAYYGVDVFFMSWWKPTDVTDTYLKKGFMKAPNNNKIKFAMVVEPLGELDTLDGKRDGIVDFDSSAVVKAWIDIFRYFKANFFSHPSYYKVGGKPVVLVYVTRTFLHFGPQYLDSLQAAVGDLYIMADEAFIGTQADPVTARNGWRNRQSVFPSYVSYNSYEAGLLKPNDSAITYQRRVAMPYYQAWAAKTIFHPPIMPYYQDFRAGHPPLPGNVPQFRDIIKDIRALPMSEPATDSLNRIYMVTSWNEWFEGTSIEPSVERGIDYCRTLREAFVEQGAHSRREPVQVLKETPVRIKSEARNAYLCIEKDGKGNVSARPECPAGGQPLVLVDLGNTEVAFKDPATGKYMSLYTDGLLYPLQSYIGTWEIFQLTVQGKDIALRSKKTGAFLKPAPDASASIVAADKALDADALFLQDASGVGLTPRNGNNPAGAASEFRHAVSFAGEDLYVTTVRRDPVRMSLTDTQGRNLLTRQFQGGGSYSLGRIPRRGILLLTLRSGDFASEEIVVRP